MTRIIVIIIVLFAFGLLNAGFLTAIFFLRRKMRQVRTWPSVMGSVLSSSVVYRSDSEGGRTAYPNVNYSYQVSGQAYQNAKIKPGPEIGGSGAGKVVATYPAGTQVMVYYNPQNPAEAVLEKSKSSEWFFWMFIVIFNCALCIVLPSIWFGMGTQP